MIDASVEQIVVPMPACNITKLQRPALSDIAKVALLEAEYVIDNPFASYRFIPLVNWVTV
jgi:hypothetical protein